jgi:putative transposase
MILDERMLSFLRVLRDTYGNIGKEKLKPLLDAYAISLGIAPYGATKIGKIIHRYRWKTPVSRRTARRTKPAVLRRKYAPKGVSAGHCEMDGITVYFDGETYRFVSIIDVATRQAWCQWVPSFASRHTSTTLQQFQQRTGMKIHTVQTDNGSEFLGEFHAYLESHQICHEFSYPRCPRVNGMVERFNRTMQEECINRIIDSIDDKEMFRAKLEQYCVWYNEKRPHYALRYQTPQAYALTLTGGQ